MYNNHIESIKIQLLRGARPLPRLVVDDSIATKAWDEITIDDFTLIGYFPHPTIKMQMGIVN